MAEQGHVPSAVARQRPGAQQSLLPAHYQMDVQPDCKPAGLHYIIVNGVRPMPLVHTWDHGNTPAAATVPVSLTAERFKPLLCPANASCN
jgi:hypothetical protein